MLMRVLGGLAGLLGLALLVFAVMTWRELRRAATSELAPNADSMPLTRLVCPEFFDAGNAGDKPAKPAELARATLNRIYIIGGGSLALVVVGGVVLVLPQCPRAGQGSPEPHRR